MEYLSTRQKIKVILFYLVGFVDGCSPRNVQCEGTKPDKSVQETQISILHNTIKVHVTTRVLEYINCIK